jgi:hypothetical protein
MSMRSRAPPKENIPFSYELRKSRVGSKVFGVGKFERSVGEDIGKNAVKFTAQSPWMGLKRWSTYSASGMWKHRPLFTQLQM